MKRNVLLDTGPLVALLDRRDHYHPWAKARFAEVEPPLLTCEAVLTEAVHLLRHLPTGARAVLDLLRLGVLSTPFSVAQESHRLGQLLESYADVPMAFADGCLVRLAELHPGSEILTIDSDFKIYRIHGRQVIPTILPPEIG